MSNKNSSKTTSDPTSRNYPKVMKNKANEKSLYGEDEPSPSTTNK